MRKIWEKCKKFSLREWGKKGLSPGGSVLWGGVGGIGGVSGVRKYHAKWIGGEKGYTQEVCQELSGGWNTFLTRVGQHATISVWGRVRYGGKELGLRLGYGIGIPDL